MNNLRYLQRMFVFCFRILAVVRIRWANCFYQSISIVCCWNSCSEGRGTKVVRCVTAHTGGKLVALCLLHWLGSFADSTCWSPYLSPWLPLHSWPTLAGSLWTNIIDVYWLEAFEYFVCVEFIWAIQILIWQAVWIPSKKACLSLIILPL